MVIPDRTKTDELSTDIVIVGAGGGGLSAALTAAEGGAHKVIIIEKLHAPGGNALRAFFSVEGIGMHNNIDNVERQDEYFRKAMEWSHWRMDARLVRTLIEKAPDTVRWLLERGVKSGKPGRAGGSVVKVLINKCKEMGVQILCDTKAKKLLTDKDNRVIGVLAEVKDKQLRIEAKSVIISTGGFISNKELMKKYFHSYNDNLYDEVCIEGLPHTGDGLQIATEIGAATDGTVAFEWEGNRFPWLSVASALSDMLNNETHKAPIWVNKRGERFSDETTIDATNSLYRQPHKVSYTLFDESIKQSIYQEGRAHQVADVMAVSDSPFEVEAEKDIRSQEQKGRVKISDSWDEIAKWMGAEPEVLKATIDQYNSFCDKGRDAHFLKDPKYLIPLRTPPYYAVKCGLAMLLTRGPLKVNPCMEVLDKNDNPILGLYAAGVDIGGTDSDTYWGTGPGHSFGFALSSGRLAAENTLEYIKSTGL